MTWIWPLTGPITCDFACHVTEGRTPGLDIAIPTGTPIHASRSGSVMISQFDPTAGNYVQIDHGDSISRYLHQSRLDVIVGQTVVQGQQLGLSGTTGNSTGPHLHWDIGYKSEVVAKAIQPDSVFKFNRWFVDPEILLQEDWFDMATKEELQQIVEEVLNNSERIKRMEKDLADLHQWYFDPSWDVDTQNPNNHAGKLHDHIEHS